MKLLKLKFYFRIRYWTFIWCGFEMIPIDFMMPVNKKSGSHPHTYFFIFHNTYGIGMAFKIDLMITVHGNQISENIQQKNLKEENLIKTHLWALPVTTAAHSQPHTYFFIFHNTELAWLLKLILWSPTRPRKSDL